MALCRPANAAAPFDQRAMHAEIYRGLDDADPAQRAAAFAQCNESFRTIKLHVTAACDLRCQNCYSDRHAADSLTTAEIFQLLDQLRGRPCRLDLLGGEPLAHPDLLDIIRYAKQQVGIAEIFLYTNGARLDEHLAADLHAAGVDTAIVSLHARDPDVHDRLTTLPGSHARTRRGIELLSRAGVRAYSFTVVSAANHHLLAEMLRLGEELEVGSLFFPYVRQRRDDPLAITGAEDLRRATRFMLQQSYAFDRALRDFANRGCRLCRAFTQTVTIKANGSVTPCPFVDLPIGNVRDGELFAILAASHDHLRLADFLTLPEECAECSLRPVCGGGCKASGYTAFGDLRQKDLSCLDGPFSQRISISELRDYLPYLY